MISSSNPGDFDRLLDADGHNDLADFSGFVSAVSIDLRNPSESVFTNDTTTAIGGTFRAIAELVGIENIDGTHHNDLIIGEGSSSGLDGLLGSDTIIGGFGDDTYRISVSNAGDFDRLLDSAGEDDFADLSEFASAVRVDMTNPSVAVRTNDTATATGGTFRDMAEMVGIENFRGTAFNDHITGEGSGNEIEAGAGNDTIIGGGGNDGLLGQAGSDIFIFADGHGRDVIRDFDALDANEKIDLSGIAAITSFADLPGHRLSRDGADAVIDTGTGEIRLTGVNIDHLDESDFIF